MNVNGKVFVITGAGNGMGREVALQLVAKGARVVGVDLSAAGLAETASRAKSDVATHALDVTDPTAVDALVKATLESHGHVDALVNIAGIIHRFVPVDQLSRDELHRVMNVNFWGTVTPTLAFLPHLKARPESALVNMSSLSALTAFAGQTLYSASKGAVKQFSEGLFQELIGTNVTISTIFPGNIGTDISTNSGVEMISAGDRKVRATSPADAGAAIVRGIEKGSFRIIVGQDARIIDRLGRLSPFRTAKLIGRQMKSVL